MTDLAQLEQMQRVLAEAENPADTALIIDGLAALRHTLRKARAGTWAVNGATGWMLKAERQLADQVDEGQRQGRIARAGGDRPIARNPGNGTAHLSEIGLDSQRLAEARKIRDRYTDAQIDALVEAATEEDRCLARDHFLRGTPQITHNSGEYEYYTPAPYIDAAREVMGGIDLDPASSETANRTVGAASYHTVDTDGLIHPWGGRVWLNPPFARGLVNQFIAKLLDEHTTGNVTQAVTLTHNATETAWGQRLLSQATAVCFPAGRINFHDATGQPRTDAGALQGQMVAYLGHNPQQFLATFNKFGVCRHA